MLLDLQLLQFEQPPWSSSFEFFGVVFLTLLVGAIAILLMGCSSSKSVPAETVAAGERSSDSVGQLGSPSQPPAVGTNSKVAILASANAADAAKKVAPSSAAPSQATVILSPPAPASPSANLAVTITTTVYIRSQASAYLRAHADVSVTAEDARSIWSVWTLHEKKQLQDGSAEALLVDHKGRFLTIQSSNLQAEPTVVLVMSPELQPASKWKLTHRQGDEEGETAIFSTLDTGMYLTATDGCVTVESGASPQSVFWLIALSLDSVVKEYEEREAVLKHEIERLVQERGRAPAHLINQLSGMQDEQQTVIKKLSRPPSPV
jgi:hypothetical protein